jgi:hypothetical protein
MMSHEGLRLACYAGSRDESGDCEQESTQSSEHDFSLGWTSGFGAVGRIAMR